MSECCKLMSRAKRGRTSPPLREAEAAVLCAAGAAILDAAGAYVLRVTN